MVFGLREHLSTLFRHWGKISLVLIGALFVAFGFAFLPSKVFIADARILILDRDPVQIVSGMASGNAGVLFSPQEQVLTQVAIVRSPLLAERVAERIGPEVVLENMAWRWDWLRDWLSGIPGWIKDTVIRLMQDFEPTRTVLDWLGVELDPGSGPSALVAARQKILTHLICDAVPKTNMFVVAFESPDPAFSARLVNEMLDVYVQHVGTLYVPVRTAALAADEADRLQRELREAELELQVFAKERDIVSLERQKNLLIDRLSNASQELSDLERELLEAEQKIGSINTQIEELPSSSQLSVVTRRNPVASGLISRIAELETQAQQFVPGSPAAAQLQQEIAAVRAQLRQVSRSVSDSETVGATSTYQELQTTLVLQRADARALAVRAEVVGRQVQALREELRTLDSYEVEFNQLSREVAAKEEALTYALRRKEETAISERLTDASLSKAVPVEPATVPQEAARPRRMLVLLLGGIVGLFGGVGVAYATEFLRRTVATREEAESALGLRVLATLDRVSRRGQRRGANLVGFRRLAGGLREASSDQGAPVVLLASARPGEGRSYVADNLAENLRQDGLAVRLIKVDSRNAPVGRETRRQADDAEVRFESESAEGAPLPPDRIDVVRATGSHGAVFERMVNGLDAVRANRDIVIVDPPAMDVCPDQSRLAARADAVLFLIEAERTPAVVAKRVLELLSVVEAPVLGCILNKRRYAIPAWAYRWLLLWA